MTVTSLKRPLPTSEDGSSLSSKVYVRTTRQGKTQKIVREVYLRNDIPCSSKLCATCPAIAPRNSHDRVTPPVLSERPAGTRSFPHGHYLVPDTNAFLTGMDLFEVESAFEDVIVLQTVLEEVKNRSLPVYHRLVQLIKEGEKRFYVFFNDFRQDTYVLRKQSESINDRNDRAIRKAVSWYSAHLGSNAKKASSASRTPAVVMLSNDRANLDVARTEKLNATSLADYVNTLHQPGRLLDMIREIKDEAEAQQTPATRQIYPKYLSESKVRTGINNGTLHQGTFSVSPYNYLQASVHVAAFDQPLLVLGRENANRAVQGDVVVVELLPKDQWKRPSSTILEEENINKDDNAEVEEEEAVVTLREKKALQEEAKQRLSKGTDGQAQPTARVMGVVKRNWRQYVGHVDQASMRSSSASSRTMQTVFLLPMDKRVPKIRLRTRLTSELVGKRIVVAIDAWDQDSRYPSGHFVRDLGDLEAKGAETEALLMEYDVQYRPFPKAVLECLPSEGHDWKVPEDVQDPLWTGRRDLRDLLVCSIDPPGCVDIDDALHARNLPNGNFEVGVHIADVSHFVKPNTAMDEEASARGTTVYLVDKRIDMLPPLLGTDLCSLKPYVERFAFSVLWEVTPAAEVVSADFTKSVIRSKEAFAYEEAQNRIDNTKQQDELTKGMRILLSLSKKLRDARMEAGALNLASPEVRVQIDSETSDPQDVQTKQLLDTNSLVEEFMLLANTTVAAKIQSEFPQTALLRRHGAPPKNNFDELQKQLKVKRDMQLQTESSKALADSLDRCVDPAEPFLNTLIRIMATRCMMSAEYFCSGAHPYSEYRHYGLASEIYTHFTSPIRRYADLLVHRQLAVAIGFEQADPSIHNKNALEKVCKNINLRHRNAQFASRASVEHYVGQALKGQTIDEYGHVMKVFSNGFVVFVPRFGIEGLIRLRDIADPEPQAVFDADTYTLTMSGSRSMRIELFQRVRVRINDEQEESTGKRKVKLRLI